MAKIIEIPRFPANTLGVPNVEVLALIMRVA